MNYQDTLYLVTEYGYKGARLEHTGGGVMVISAPIPNARNSHRVAWLNEFGLGVYRQAWDQEAEHFYEFENEPTNYDILNALEWLEAFTERGNK